MSIFLLFLKLLFFSGEFSWFGKTFLLNNLKRMTDLYYESNLLQTENEKYTYTDIQKKYSEILKQPELKSEKNVLSFSESFSFPKFTVQSIFKSESSKFILLSDSGE